MDLRQHLIRQMVWSRATFGPGAQTTRLIDHIKLELVEVEKATDRQDRVKEWADVVILALDGLTREMWAAIPKEGADGAAKLSAFLILQKQAANELREWPDWRTADPDKAIEHVRTGPLY